MKVAPEASEAAEPQTTGDSETGVRRCVVTRNRASREQLLRFVVGPSGEIVFDVRQKAPGRGIYVLPNRDILDQAARGAIRRGAKQNVTLPDPERWVESEILPGLERYYRELIGLGRKSGQLLLGSNVVDRAAKADQLAGYLLATDASDGTRKKYEQNAGRKEIPVYGRLSRSELGDLLGRDEVVVAGWQPGTLHQRFTAVARQLRRLLDGA